MPSILLDTNVLLYGLDLREPSKQQRAEVVLAALQRNRFGCLSTQNLAEFVSLATRKLQPPLSAAEAYQRAAQLASSFKVFDLTVPIVLEAARGMRDHRLSYYDAQLWATARLNQVPVIFTEDFTDGRTLEYVRYINPFAADFDLSQWA